MAIRLYICRTDEEFDKAGALEVMASTCSNKFNINGIDFSVASKANLSAPQYRKGVYPTLEIVYSYGSSERSEDIADIKARMNEHGFDVTEKKDDEDIRIPFLDLIFPRFTRISVSNF